MKVDEKLRALYIFLNESARNKTFINCYLSCGYRIWRFFSVAILARPRGTLDAVLLYWYYLRNILVPCILFYMADKNKHIKNSRYCFYRNLYS